MAYFVYNEPNKNIEADIKRRYVNSIVENEDMDENYKKQVSKLDIKIKRRWIFRCITKFKKLDFKVFYKIKYRDSYTSTSSKNDSVATVNTDVGKYVVTKSGNMYKAEDYKSTSSTSESYIVEYEKFDTCSFGKENNPFILNYGPSVWKGMGKYCDKYDNIKDIPDIVDKTIINRIKTFNILEEKDLYFDTVKNEFSNIYGFVKSSFRIDSVLEKEIESCDYYIFPIYDIEVQYLSKNYFVQNINPFGEFIDTESDDAGKKSEWFNKIKHKYKRVTFVSKSLLICSIITSIVLFFLYVTETIKSETGIPHTILWLRVLLIDFVGCGFYFGLKSEENNSKKYMDAIKNLKWFNLIYFIISLTIFLIVTLVKFKI